MDAFKCFLFGHLFILIFKSKMILTLYSFNFLIKLQKSFCLFLEIIDNVMPDERDENFQLQNE